MSTTPLEKELNDIIAGDSSNEDITAAVQELVDEAGAAAVLAYANNYHLKLVDIDDWAYDFRDSYIGELTPAEYAEQFLEDVGDLAEVPNRLRYYIDFEKFGRDMELGGDIWEEGGHLFRGN